MFLEIEGSSKTINELFSFSNGNLSSRNKIALLAPLECTVIVLIVSNQFILVPSWTGTATILQPLISHDSFQNRLPIVMLGYTILVPMGDDSLGQHQGSRHLADPRFTGFPSNMANLIGWECKTNTLRTLRISGPVKGTSQFLGLSKRSRASGDENAATLSKRYALCIPDKRRIDAC